MVMYFNKTASKIVFVKYQNQKVAIGATDKIKTKQASVYEYGHEATTESV